MEGLHLATLACLSLAAKQTEVRPGAHSSTTRTAQLHSTHEDPVWRTADQAPRCAGALSPLTSLGAPLLTLENTTRAGHAAFDGRVGVARAAQRLGHGEGRRARRPRRIAACPMVKRPV